MLTVTHIPLQIGSHIKRRVQELGHGCAALVTKAGALQCSPSDAYTKKELIETARKVSEKVGGLREGFDSMVRWEGCWIQPCALGATMSGSFLVLLDSISSLGCTPLAQLMG